jgi:hypothetical protein
MEETHRKEFEKWYRWSMTGWKVLEDECLQKLIKYKEIYPDATNEWIFYGGIYDYFEFSRPHNFLIKQHDLLDGDICSKCWMYNRYIEYGTNSDKSRDYRFTILRYMEREEDFKPLINARKRKFFQS